MAGQDLWGEAGGTATLKTNNLARRCLGIPSHTEPHLAVFPQLVALHAVAVVEGDWAGMGDSVEAELLGVLRVSRPDVLPPGEGKDLHTQEHC